ncbi:MAG: branched chain amino acid aminotransferase, partial [Longicatena sp.]
MKIEYVKAKTLKEKPAWDQNLGFGKYFSDYMFTMDWTIEEGWNNAKIEPYGPLCLDPATLVLHYAQETFEGLKAYKAKDGRILMFRPEMNAKRFANSNTRLCMEVLPEDMFVEAIETLV